MVDQMSTQLSLFIAVFYSLGTSSLPKGHLVATKTTDFFSNVSLELPITALCNILVVVSYSMKLMAGVKQSVCFHFLQNVATSIADSFHSLNVHYYQLKLLALEVRNSF